MSHVDKLANILTRMGESDLTIEPNGCVRLRSPRATCAKCETACPNGVISWDGGLSVDPLLCDDCGKCASACMNGVFTLSRKDPCEDLIRALEVADLRQEDRLLDVFVSCERHSGCSGPGRPEPSIELEVPCYGALDGWFFATAFTRTAVSMELAYADCSKCSRSAGHDHFTFWTEKDIRIRAGKRGKRKVRQNSVRAVSSKQASTPRTAEASRVSRRRFFSRLGIAVVGEVERPPRSLEKEAILSRVLPEKRKRPIGSDDAWMWLPFFDAAVDDHACNFCGKCWMLCPSGALDRVEEAGPNGNPRTGIFFQPAFCTGCMLCKDVCLNSAITISELEVVRALDLETSSLASFEVSRCTKCGDALTIPNSSSDSSPVFTSREHCCPSCDNNAKADDVLSDLLGL